MQNTKLSNNNNYSFKCAVNSFVSTYIAGALHPLDVIKTRFQSHDGKSRAQNLVPKYSGILNGFKTIYREEGLKGLYKGFHISIFSQAFATAIFFWLYLYQAWKHQYIEKGWNHMNAVAMASLEASMCGTLLTQPLWVIKTRMLLNTKPQISQIQNIRYCCRQIMRQNGIFGYSKGLGLSLILAFAGPVQMYSYEGLKKIYQYLEIPETSLAEKNFICGAACKIVVAFVNYPITTIRTRIQQNQFVKDDTTIKYKSISEIILRTKNGEGILGFYKGFEANLLKGVIQKGIYFYLYEMFKKHLIDEQIIQPE